MPPGVTIVPAVPAMIASASCRRPIAAVSPVASGPAFVVRGDANKAITLIGIDPAHYNRVISLSDRLTAGQLRVGAGEAVIGIELAKDLGADVGDKLRISSLL